MPDSELEPPDIGSVTKIFFYVGVVCTTIFTGRFCYLCAMGFRNFIWAYCRPKDVRNYGEWAVVTGCTDGIGKSYAKELARRGMNIVLISRSMEKLKRVAEEIGTFYNVKTHIIQADFSKGRPIYEDIRQQLMDKDIGVLVNNVGVVQEIPSPIHAMSDEEVWSLINVNVAAVTNMTRIVLPSMIQKKNGAIINLSSGTAVGPTPLLGIYSATKIYISYLSEALHVELNPHGITVQCIFPFYVATNMTKYSDIVGKPGLIVATSDKYARSALNTLGYSHKTTGYWLHGLQYRFCTAGTTWMWTKLSYLWHWNLRRQYLREKNSYTSHL